MFALVGLYNAIRVSPKIESAQVSIYVHRARCTSKSVNASKVHSRSFGRVSLITALVPY